jgi:mRNA-degrading endonuclease RelE of RelBE toxin-antitoxin system
LIYNIVIEKKACKEADDIPGKYRASIDSGILSLASNPRPHAAKKLTEKKASVFRHMFSGEDIF